SPRPPGSHHPPPLQLRASTQRQLPFGVDRIPGRDLSPRRTVRMSLTPETTPQPEALPAPPPVPAPPARAPGTLRRRLWVLLFAIFAFEVGSFLVVFPWMDSWSLNHLPGYFASNQIAV